MLENWAWKRKKLSEIWKWPHVKLFNYIGLWVEQTLINQNKRKLLSLWGKCNIILCILNIISVIAAVFFNFSSADIANSLYSLYPVIPNTLATLKVIEIERNRESFKKAMDLLDELTRGIKDPEGMKMLRKRMIKIWKIFSVSISLFIVMDIHWIMRPILMILMYDEWTQIFKEWPVFIDTWIQYVLTYIYQFYIIALYLYVYTLFDNLFFSISELILGHFSVLENHMQKLHFRSESDDLRRIVKCHVKLLEISYQLRESTSAVLIFQIITTVFLGCVGLYIIIMGNNVSINIRMNLAEGSIFIFGHLFVSCWYSNEITNKCKDFKTSAYLAVWTEGDETQKKIILNLMTMTMSPVTFGGFMKIDLNTFTDVLKTTFSYFNFVLAVLESNLN